MQKQLLITLWLGIMTVCFISLSSFKVLHSNPTSLNLLTFDGKLKEVAFQILDTKCNACHRKQNPFMVFSEKNMVKRAPKIYKMVFVERRMPKGDEIKLTSEEYTTLEKWLFTQQIF